MLNEFKKFVLRGNILDMAIGVMLGGAFTKVVTSLTSDILMPPIGMLMGGVDFSNLYVNLTGGSYPSLEEAKKAGAVTINLGVFANVVLDFIIVAFAVFILMKGVSRLMGRQGPIEPPK